MEFVSIQEAARRLRLATSSIRECIRNEELKARRQPGPNGRLTWMVELPEEGWTSAATELELGRDFVPWWWTNEQRTGGIHYIQDLYTSSFEEIVPRFLCGLSSDSIWPAPTLPEEELCVGCLSEARQLGLTLSL